MIFWKKDKPKEIRSDLKSIRKKTKNLKILKERSNKTRDVIIKIKALIEEAKKDILERGISEKSKPWISSAYDSEIDKMSLKENEALDKLSSDLDEYLELLDISESDEDLDLVIGELEKEEESIQARESVNEKAIKRMENETLAERLKEYSEPVPANKTKDGVPWRNIVNVARQLGGKGVNKRSGRHSFQLEFPHASSPVPLSCDATSTKLASQIIEKLPVNFPEYKIPNKSKLAAALKAGDIHRAA